eukprot:UC1_evm1s1532
MAALAPSAFCVEPITDPTTGALYCPTWAGGSGNDGTYNASAGTWITVDITSATANSVTVDLGALNGSAPTGVRYSWGIFECCNAGDPTLYVQRPCNDSCPITAKGSGLPANPFIAKITAGKCECIAPQVCS